MIDLRPNRRRFAATALGLAGLAALPGPLRAAAVDTSGLTPITSDLKPIDAAERAARIARAQALMAKAGMAAIVVEPGSSLDYFTGIKWWRSERVTAAIIPASGQPVIVTPFFEEPSIRQSLGVSADVRVWQEDEDPLALVAEALRQAGGATSAIGIEETVRFFISDGLARRLPQARIASANPVVRACRMVKTATEIALMQAASDVTLTAQRWAWQRIRAGMTPGDIAALIDAATAALGGKASDGLVLLGEASAYPHGSAKPQAVREGEVVLIDCGCSVGGYASDISRSFVFGRVPDDVRRVWDVVAEGQQRALAAAQLGTPAGAVGRRRARLL